MSPTLLKTQQGFTLIELMIVVTIIGILASVAMPSYQSYVKKAKFSEVVMAASAAKIGVELCFQNTASITGCTGGGNGIPLDISTTTNNNNSYLTTITAKDGVITATATGSSSTAEKGLNGETYIIKPTTTSGKVIWTTDTTSTCITAGIC
ncbi:MAG TPA: pilus assembly protein TapA [Methylococcaceae bacterium]|nr:pilus assembly protein TapA [Methylococcaceae bacterium]